MYSGCNAFAFVHLKYIMIDSEKLHILYHQLYTDDTQRFFSFHLTDFQAHISHTQNDLTQITFRTNSLISQFL